MRCMDRNTQVVWWSSYEQVPILHQGYETGEYKRAWTEPTKARFNVSPPYGRIEDSPFGTDVSYNCMIRAVDVPFSIDDRVWVQPEPPQKLANGEYDIKNAYKVVKIAHSLNSVAVALFSVGGN